MTRLGTAVDPDRDDYIGAVLWQAQAGALWARFATTLRRTLAAHLDGRARTAEHYSDPDTHLPRLVADAWQLCTPQLADVPAAAPGLARHGDDPAGHRHPRQRPHLATGRGPARPDGERRALRIRRPGVVPGQAGGSGGI
jgi:replication initiator protein RepSA